MGKDEVLAVCRAVSIDASGAQIIISGVDSVAAVGFRAWKNGLIGSLENNWITARL